MLTFPYWEELRGSEPRFLPLVPLTIPIVGGSIHSTYALLDTGAEHNVFGLDVAEALSIDVTKLPEAPIVGVGGNVLPGYLGALNLLLGAKPDQVAWRAPVIFSPLTEHPLLGQVGFFDSFNVTFRYAERSIEISSLDEE